MKVLLHGFTGAPSSWDAIRQAMSGPCVAPPLPGHGAPPVEDWEEAVDRIAAHCEDAHIVGYSLGARLALGVLVRHPDKVRRATLIGVNPGTDDRATRRRWEAELVRLLLHDGIEAFVRHWEELPLWASQTRLPGPVLEAQRAVRLAHDPRGLAHSLQTLGLGAMPDLRPFLPELRIPVDLVVGALDGKFLDIAHEFAARCRSARVVVVPDVGHNVVLEAPDRLARILQSPPEDLAEGVAR